MTLSAKPEVHNILHCYQRTTEPRSRVTCTENRVKFRRVVVEICERTDRQTNKHIKTRWSQYVAYLPGANVINKSEKTSNPIPITRKHWMSIAVACSVQLRCWRPDHHRAGAWRSHHDGTSWWSAAAKSTTKITRRRRRRHGVTEVPSSSEVHVGRVVMSSASWKRQQAPRRRIYIA